MLCSDVLCFELMSFTVPGFHPEDHVPFSHPATVSHCGFNSFSDIPCFLYPIQ